MERLEDKVRRVLAEPIAIVDYDPAWPQMYADEAEHLTAVFPEGSILRMEHIGSTAVPGLAAKPVVDILIGVADLEVVREQVAPRLEAQGYDFFWRPTHGDDGGPFYPWFIGRDAHGARTHHIHVVAMTFDEHWDRVLFRDYLRAHPDVAAEYARLKRRLASDFGDDREMYTEQKTSFIICVTELARRAAEGQTDGPGGPTGSTSVSIGR